MNEKQARFDALLKEADLLRAETLLCIGHVRRMTGFVTSIAGAGIPLLAAILNIGSGAEKMSIGSIADLNKVIMLNSIVVQSITLSISITCLAFLRIYLGIFMQIFTIAEYFRDHLIGEINKLVLIDENNQKVFYWEQWLRSSRSKNNFNVGDFDLAIEPYLMVGFSLMYALLACYVSYISTNAFITYTISAAIFIISMLSIRKFIKILDGSVQVKDDKN